MINKYCIEMIIHRVMFVSGQASKRRFKLTELLVWANEPTFARGLQGNPSFFFFGGREYLHWPHVFSIEFVDEGHVLRNIKPLITGVLDGVHLLFSVCS